ncbi:hypothetical protein [Nonomuraea sp. CA-141351]|uniref:hypothetical protein n=1 Tax=Nonomuraea sp. CA-141351 TaxID=3239996 RepID=UPI003D917C82
MSRNMHLVAPAAVAAKPLPGALSDVVANGVAWRRLLGIAVPATLVVALSFLPYVPASGTSVAGHLQEERYDGHGNRYAVLRLLLPYSWAPYVAITLLALIVLAVLRYGDAERSWRGALLAVALEGAVAYAAGPAALDSFGTPFQAAAAPAVLIGWVVRRPHRVEISQ